MSVGAHLQLLDIFSRQSLVSVVVPVDARTLSHYISFRRLVELKLKGKESTGCGGQQTAHAENNAEDLPLRLGGECLDSIGGGLEDW